MKNFEISPSGFAEDLPKSDFATSMDYVRETSKHKLHHKLDELAQAGKAIDILITADSIISYNDQEVVEKPADEAEAFSMIKKHCETGSH